MNEGKPLGKKAYGSIPHLPGSRVGPGDYHISPGQAIIATQKKRDKHDVVIVQEKLDGSNMAVAKLDGQILPLTRSGYLANTSKYLQQILFHKWVNKNVIRFDELLQEGERVCGEWLALAHGTKYDLKHEPFVPFDIMTGNNRINFSDFKSRVEKFEFTIPNTASIGEPVSIESALALLGCGAHGACETIEGAVWRVERKGVVDFLCKYVRPEKIDGKYFIELTGLQEVWNIDINNF